MSLYFGTKNRDLLFMRLIKVVYELGRIDRHDANIPCCINNNSCHFEA